jgi:hypothetical protein
MFIPSKDSGRAKGPPMKIGEGLAPCG